MTPEVLIVGGGVIGLSIARQLRNSGVRRVTLVEKGRCGEESSWAAGGMLGPQVETDCIDEFYRFCSDSRDLYPEFAAELFDETGVDIELERTGTMSLAFTDEDAAELTHRFEWQNSAGLEIENLSSAQVLKAERHVSPRVRMGLYFRNDWQVENKKLLVALRRYAELNGITILEGTPVERLVVDGARVIGAETDRGPMHADLTIAATGAWTSLIKLGQSAMPVRVEPVRGQIVAFQGAERLFGHVIYSRRGYVVPRVDGRILAGSTTEHVGFDKRITADAAKALIETACEIVPGISRLPVIDQWSGLRPYAADGLPILGPIGGIEGLIVATAHYRNGILLAPLTAQLVAESALSGSNPVAEYSPDRFCLAAAV